MESSEQDLEGDLVFVSALRPLTDSPDIMISVSGRQSPQEAATYIAEVAIDSSGDASFELETRYAKARGRIPSGSKWTYIRGFQPEVGPAGDQ